VPVRHSRYVYRSAAGTARLSVVLALAAIMVLWGAPAAKAKTCGGVVQRSTNVAALRADHISVTAGVSCTTGRAVLRGFLGLIIRDADCLHASQFAGGGCGYQSYLCFRGNIGVPQTNSCVSSKGTVNWRERDYDVS
jgi:hypothetical protein